MARVFAEVLGAVNDVALASKVVDSVGDALRIDVLLGTGSEVFLLLHAERVLNTVLEHGPRLLAKLGVLVVARLKVFLPSAFDKRSHAGWLGLLVPLYN